jgi:hypothetical protein
MGGATHTFRQVGLALALVSIAVVARAPCAQTPPAGPPAGPLARSAVELAADNITATELAQHIRVLMTDSLRGRDTPSPALQRTAQYLVHQFQQLGLRPLSRNDSENGKDSVWIQRYPVPGQRRLNYDSSRVLFVIPPQLYRGKGVVTETGKPLVERVEIATFATAAHFLRESGPPVVVAPLIVGYSFGFVAMGSEEVVLVSGRQSPASLRQAPLEHKVVIYAPPVGLDSATFRQVLRQLYTTAQGVILAGEEDSTRFAAAVQAARQQPVPVLEAFLRDPLGKDRWPWAAAVWPPIVQRVLAAAGVDLDLTQVRVDTTPRVRAVPFAAAWLVPVADSGAPTPVTAPNVIARLDGTDSVLQHEVVVIAAHMDTGVDTGTSAGGARPGQVESRDRGATDNVAGVAGLLALAKAFSQPGAGPRRSVVFLAVSGGAKDLWGSRFFVQPENLSPLGLRRSDRIVANLTLDLSGRRASDSVMVDGADDFDALALPPVWAAAAHPELRLTVVDGGAVLPLRADHVPFARQGVPSLYLYAGVPDTGVHGAVRPGPDMPAALDADGAARVTRLVFYVGHAIANAAQRPRQKLGASRRNSSP